MKKSTKFLLLGGLSLSVAGLIIIIVASAIGGTVKISQMMRNGDFSIKVGNGIIGIANLFENENTNENKTIHRGGEGTRTGNADKVLVGTREEIKSLSIQYGRGTFNFMESEDDSVYLTINTFGETYYGVDEDGFLFIEQSGSIEESGTIELYLPKDMTFEEVNVKLGAGALRARTISSNNIQMSIRAGEIDVHMLSADNAEISVDAGEVHVGKGTVGNLVMDVDMGEAKYEGTISGDSDFTCAAGDIELDLNNRQEEFNYDISCGAGEVSIGNMHFGGLAFERVIDNGQEKQMSVDCGLGTIRIEFEE